MSFKLLLYIKYMPIPNTPENVKIIRDYVEKLEIGIFGYLLNIGGPEKFREKFEPYLKNTLFVSDEWFLLAELENMGLPASAHPLFLTELLSKFSEVRSGFFHSLMPLLPTIEYAPAPEIKKLSLVPITERILTEAYDLGKIIKNQKGYFLVKIPEKETTVKDYEGKKSIVKTPQREVLVCEPQPINHIRRRDISLNFPAENEPEKLIKDSGLF